MWDQSTVDRLIELKEEGKSMSEIALALGFTKNKIAGKLFRLGLCQHSHWGSRSPSHVALSRVPIGGCLWPFGDPQKKGFHFCGERQIAGRPYCDAHTRKAYGVTGDEDACVEAAE